MKQILLLISMFFMICCHSKNSDGLKQLDLMEYGVPIVVKAPEGAQVEVSDLGVWVDVTIQGGQDYSLQIISSEATIISIDRLKREKIAEVKAEPYFSKIIHEDDHGFIYEKNIDSNIDYDFRYIKVQGNREYTFQTSLFGTFTEEQVRAMYEAVK